MSPSQSGRPPLTRLVIFIVCLSFAASVLAGVQWYIVDLPQQQEFTAPADPDETSCSSTCWNQNAACRDSCPKDATLHQCLSDCMDGYYQCTCRNCNLNC